MFEGGRIWSLFSLATAIISFVLTIYLWRKEEQSHLLREAAYLCLILGLAAFVDMLANNAPDREWAIFLNRILLFLVVAFFGAYIFMALRQMAPGYQANVRQYENLFITSILILAGICAMLLDQVVKDDYGWGAWGIGWDVTLMLVMVFFILTLIILAASFISVKDENNRQRVMLMGLAVSMPYVYGYSTIFFEGSTSLEFPRNLSIGVLFMTLVMVFAILRYQLFMIIPRTEDKVRLPVVSQELPSTVPGRSYLVEAKRQDAGYEMLLHELNEGRHGLVITMEHPERVREKYHLTQTPVIWLTSQAGPERVDPTNLSILQYTISDFLGRGQEPVLLLDGVEYLIMNNKLEKVLQLCLMLRDEIITVDGKMIIYIDPETLEERTLAFLERDFEVIDRMPPKTKVVEEPAVAGEDEGAAIAI